MEHILCIHYHLFKSRHFCNFFRTSAETTIFKQDTSESEDEIQSTSRPQNIQYGVQSTPVRYNGYFLFMIKLMKYIFLGRYFLPIHHSTRIYMPDYNIIVIIVTITMETKW